MHNIPEQIWNAVGWVIIISCVAWWLKYLIKDVIEFLIRDEEAHK